MRSNTLSINDLRGKLLILAIDSVFRRIRHERFCPAFAETFGFQQLDDDE